MQGTVERKTVQRRQPLDARDGTPPIQQQNTRVAVDTRPYHHVISVTRNNSDVKAIITGTHINVRIPRRMRQHHPVARLRRGIQLHPGPHKARKPRVRMLTQRAKRHFRTRMPRTRLSRQAITLAHQRDMRRIKTIGHRRPLGCRQIKPRGALRRPRRRGATAKRNERRLDAGIMGINNEGQGIT